MQLMVKAVLSSRLKISKIYRDHDGCFGDPNSFHLGSTTETQPMPLESGFDLLSITSGHYKFSCFPIKTAANACKCGEFPSTRCTVPVVAGFMTTAYTIHGTYCLSYFFHDYHMVVKLLVASLCNI